MNLTKQQRKNLIEKYPYLQPVNVWTGEVDENYDYEYMWGENDLPQSWVRLFLLYCKNIRPYLVSANYLNSYQFTQVKEKYGSMRIYDTGAPQAVRRLNSMYEGFSTNICACGNPASWETASWVMYLCDECAKKINGSLTPYKQTKQNNVIKYTNNTKTKISYSYKSIRKEYKHIQKMSDVEFYRYLIGGHDATEKHYKKEI